MVEKIRVLRDPINPKHVTLLETNGTRTTVHESDSYGLVIEQINPQGVKARAKYGNDEVGYELYIHLLNYLLATHQPIPPFTRTRSLGDFDRMKENSLQVKTEYEILQPLPSTHAMEMSWNGTVTPVQDRDGKSGIAFGIVDRKPLFLSNELIPALVRIIPRLFQARERGFQVIYAHMTKSEVRKMVRPLRFTPYEELFSPKTGGKSFRPQPPAEYRVRRKPVQRKRRR